MLSLLAFVVSLRLDSLAAAAAPGAVRSMTAGERLRSTALFVVFEAGTPLIGLGLGSTAARALGGVAGYLPGRPRRPGQRSDPPSASSRRPLVRGAPEAGDPDPAATQNGESGGPRYRNPVAFHHNMAVSDLPGISSRKADN